MASPSVQPNPPRPASQGDILPTLFGKGYGNYDVRPNNFVFSFLTHVLAGLLIVIIPILLTLGVMLPIVGAMKWTINADSALGAMPANVSESDAPA